MFNEVWVIIRAYLDNERELKAKEELSADNRIDTYQLKEKMIPFTFSCN